MLADWRKTSKTWTRELQINVKLQGSVRTLDIFLLEEVFYLGASCAYQLILCILHVDIFAVLNVLYESSTPSQGYYSAVPLSAQSEQITS